VGSPHVPRRTCVGCRVGGDKRDLVRLVRSGGAVRVDPTGAAPGRGAYVHRDPACVDAALQRGRVDRALRVRLDEGGAATLRADIEGELGR
jgi:hypothetical protein